MSLAIMHQCNFITFGVILCVLRNVLHNQCHAWKQSWKTDSLAALNRHVLHLFHKDEDNDGCVWQHQTRMKQELDTMKHQQTI